LLSLRLKSNFPKLQKCPNLKFLQPNHLKSSLKKLKMLKSLKKKLKSNKYPYKKINR
jgi:hypothetical protein